MNQVEADGIEQRANELGKGQSIDRLHLDVLTWDGAERRRHPRYRVKWNGTLGSTSANSRSKIQARLLDVSEGGCCARLDSLSSSASQFAQLGLQERFELTVFLSGTMLRIVVEIRWYIPISEGVYGAGLEFISMTRTTRALLQAALQKLGS